MMNEYEVLVRMRNDREQLPNKVRNAQFVEDARGIEKAQPRGLRFHLNLHLPRFSGFRLSLRRQPRCIHEPLNAH